MIADKEILPFNFFEYGGKYTGEEKGMRYLIKRMGIKPDFKFSAACWRGPLASDYVDERLKTFSEFEFSEEGRIQAINWLQKQYDSRQDEWNISSVNNEIKI